MNLQTLGDLKQKWLSWSHGLSWRLAYFYSQQPSTGWSPLLKNKQQCKYQNQPILPRSQFLDLFLIRRTWQPKRPLWYNFAINPRVAILYLNNNCPLPQILSKNCIGRGSSQRRKRNPPKDVQSGPGLHIWWWSTSWVRDGQEATEKGCERIDALKNDINNNNDNNQGCERAETFGRSHLEEGQWQQTAPVGREVEAQTLSW